MNGPGREAPFRLDGKVALVTGAGSGIGEHIARLYARQVPLSSSATATKPAGRVWPRRSALLAAGLTIATLT